MLANFAVRRKVFYSVRVCVETKARQYIPYASILSLPSCLLFFCSQPVVCPANENREREKEPFWRSKKQKQHEKKDTDYLQFAVKRGAMQQQQQPRSLSLSYSFCASFPSDVAGVLRREERRRRRRRRTLKTTTYIRTHFVVVEAALFAICSSSLSLSMNEEKKRIAWLLQLQVLAST